MLDTLRLTAEFLTSVRGRRKAVLFFSEGIDYPVQDRRAQCIRRHPRHPGCRISMAARANVNYYTIDPRGLVGMTNEFMEMAGGGFARTGRQSRDVDARHERGDPRHDRRAVQRAIRFNGRADDVAGQPAQLANQTGGIAWVNTNSVTAAFNRIVEANSRYYVLGYYRRPTRAMAASTRSKDAQNARA